MKRYVTKLEIVKNQLETAIRLYFGMNDPVSIHTLAAAAYNVIKDYNKKVGGEPMIVKEKFLDHIKKTHKRTIKNKINEAENFFKHADKDHDKTMSFEIFLTELMIYDSFFTYTKLTQENPPLFKLFKVWLLLTKQDIFILNDEDKEIIKNYSDLVIQGKEYFFNTMLPVISKIN